MELPKKLKKYLNNLDYSIDDIGKSEDQVYNFSNQYILKVSSNRERLKREKERFDWFYGYLNKIKSIEFFSENNKTYYLRTCLIGEPLISKRFVDNPELLINILKEVNDFLCSIKECPFKSSDSIGESFIHGDLCLPNIYVDQNNKFIGFIDLENMGLGDKWYDYSWMIWSFERNLKTREYTNKLLNKLNISFNKEKYDEYIPFEYMKELKNK